MASGYRFSGFSFCVCLLCLSCGRFLGCMRALNTAYTLELLEAVSFLIRCKMVLDDVKCIIRSLCSQRNCVYALVFSYGDNIGVAVMFDSCDDPIRNSIELSLDLEEALGFRVNVVPLNVADATLRFEVFSRSFLVYCRDYARYLRDKATSVEECLLVKGIGEASCSFTS